MFISLKLMEPLSMSLLAMIHARKDGYAWIQKQRYLSHLEMLYLMRCHLGILLKFNCKKCNLWWWSRKFEQFPQTNSQASCNNDSTRIDEYPSPTDKRQPYYLKDFEIQRNNCTVTVCFFTRIFIKKEPTCFEKARGNREWKSVM